jgi:hypothetical protein
MGGLPSDVLHGFVLGDVFTALADDNNLNGAPIQSIQDAGFCNEGYSRARTRNLRRYLLRMLWE